MDDVASGQFFDSEDAKDARTGPPRPAHKTTRKHKSEELVGGPEDSTEEEARRFADWLETE